MKSFLATTAVVLVMGGTAYAAPAQFNTYQAQPSDVQASEFIGQRIYAADKDFTAEERVEPGAEKDWDDVGEINEVILGRDGAVKAVVLGVGGFLGMGEKNVAVSMDDVKFVRNGDGADDYFLVINANKDTLASAPAYKMPDDMRTADNAANDPATDTAANTTANTDVTTPADPANEQASGTATTTDTSTTTAANTDAAKPADATADQASSTDANTANTDTQTTASTKTDGAVKTTMDDTRARLARPDVTREGYQAAETAELTADRLEGARVYGPNDEDIGEINRIVMNDNGQVQLIVLDIGGFLGIGEREIAVTTDEVNIVRNTKGDDFRVYIDSNKDALKAQPEYKASAE